MRVGVDAAYYLDFGEGTCRRVSYAASFGRGTVEEDHQRYIGQLLPHLNAVSVREESGVRLVARLASRQASWVPDPVLLLDDYQAVLTAPEKDDIVFSYCFHGNRFTEGVQHLIAKELHARVVSPYGPEQHSFPTASRMQLGPAEWIGHIKHARAVVTNSFHGTAFSILFRKPFITVPLTGRRRDRNERAVSLLRKLNLTDRLLRGTRKEDIRRLITAAIDWEDIHSRLHTWRNEARTFLADALQCHGPAATVHVDRHEPE